jgi:hypothetical protein
MDSMIAMQLLGMNSDNKSDVLRSMSNTESAGVQRYGHETHLAAAKLPFDVAEKQREKLAEYYRELDAQPGEPGKPKPTVSVGGLLRRGIDPTSFQSAQRFNSEMQTAELGQQKTRADLNRDAYKGTALAYDAEGNRVVNPAGDDAAASRAHAVSGGRAIYGDPSANAGLVPLHQANSRATDIARANQNQGLFRTIGVYPNTPPVAPLNDKTLRGSRFEDVPFWTTDRFTRGTNWGDPRLIPDDGTEPMNLRRLGQDDLDQLRMRKKWLADQDAAEAAAKKGTTK